MTRAGGITWHREIGLCGRGDYLAATANYDLFKIKLLPELLEYFVGDLGIGRYWAGDRIIEIAKNLKPGHFTAKTKDSPMWARIILRSAQAEAGLESGTIKAAALDEADHPDFNRAAWEGVQRRLSINQGRCLFTTSLYHWGWLKHDIYDPWKAGATDIDVIQFDSIENPSFPMEEYRRMEGIMPRWKFNLLYRGIYEKPAGLIYDSFDDVVCKIKRFPLHKDWPRYVGHDFGLANPAAMFYAQDPGTGLIYAYHEYLPGQGRSPYEHVEEFKRITEGVNVINRTGGSHQEEENRQAYAAQGWSIKEPKWNKVETQIDKVYALHKLNKIMVFDDLVNYLGEKMSYSRKLDDDYKPTEEIDDKAAFHLMDAERYILRDFTPETVETGDGEVTEY
ncbi:hypothetical protein LCGC14_2667290 [marine sediment metagenome]|uniref:Phage terminase large subunit N-terminal domain-containing protein n=1 Tax=marine sediment metagenome TaxID=412755 RepID=A0A0F9C096_9ZZZZ